MSNYAWISHILNEFQLNFERVGPYRVNTKKSMTRLKYCFFFSFGRAKNEFDLFYAVEYGEMSAVINYSYTFKMSFYADSNDVCIHTFHFSHYIFAESMNFVLFCVLGSSSSVWLFVLLRALSDMSDMFC